MAVFLLIFLTMAMFTFFHYLIFFLFIWLVCLFVCLTVVGITSIPASITVSTVSTAGVSTVSAIVSAKTVSTGIGMSEVSGVEDSGVSVSLSLGVSLTLLAGVSHSGLCGNRGGKEGVVESISVAPATISNMGCSIDYCRLTGHSSYGTRNMFNTSVCNGITNSGCVVKTITKTVKTITKTKTIRMNKRGNCGCRVGDSKDSGVSLS